MFISPGKKKKKEEFYQEQLGIRGFEQHVTETHYPPHQKMICIKTSCGSMQEWHADVFLHSRRLARFQWCKRRQISPVKGDLQMVLQPVARGSRDSLTSNSKKKKNHKFDGEIICLGENQFSVLNINTPTLR